jgi:nucleoside phosphorylase
MGLFLNDIFKTSPSINSKESYNFMVVAALQEELNVFYSQNKGFSKPVPKDGGANEISFQYKKKKVKILTYATNNMGLPINAASIMKIINLHEPMYTIMIGTCACINRNHKLGDVLIPKRVFSYESGKYEDGVFDPDYEAMPTGDILRKEAELLKSRIINKLDYNVTTDEDFCSGGAVIDDKTMSDEIVRRCGRKLSGLDMEAYAIACINHLLQKNKELLVVKAISDYAKNKTESEQLGNKELAKNNSAHYTFELIKHLEDSIFATSKKVILKK